MDHCIRILCFEDNPQFVESLNYYFEDSEKIYLVASFYDATDAVKMIKEYAPDVVLMDIEMPQVSGIQALQQIKAACPETKILMQTAFEDNHKIFASLCGGASGYVLKSAGLEALEASIIEVHNGGGYFSPTIARKVINMFRDGMQRKEVEYVDLTPTEQQILQGMTEGMSYKMIEAELQKSYHAVHFHIKNIYKKMHVNSKSEAVIKAINNHLI